MKSQSPGGEGGALVARAISPAAPALMPALGPSSLPAPRRSAELSQCSPQRKLWGCEARWRKTPEGRKNAVLPPLPGLIAAFMPFPRLAPWANFFRPYGALQGVLRP
jgi:hypothetical protein